MYFYLPLYRSEFIIMHELSIVTNIFAIIDEIARQNDLKRITRVVLIVGRMRQVVPLAMDMAFQAVTKDTLAEGAELELEFIPIRMRCSSCGHEFTVEDNTFLCPMCESTRLEMMQGQELIIKHIEGEDGSP